MINKNKIFRTLSMINSGRPIWQTADKFELSHKEVKLIISWGPDPIQAYEKFKQFQKERRSLNYIYEKELEKNKILREKSKFYTDKRRKERPYYYLEARLYGFTRKTNSPKITAQMVIEKFGANPICYLTGEPIDLTNPESYWLEHRVPVSKGGLGTLENMELATPRSNQMKSNLSLEEFINVCKKIAARFPGDKL